MQYVMSDTWDRMKLFSLSWTGCMHLITSCHLFGIRTFWQSIKISKCLKLYSGYYNQNDPRNIIRLCKLNILHKFERYLVENAFLIESLEIFWPRYNNLTFTSHKFLPWLFQETLERLPAGFVKNVSLFGTDYQLYTHR